MDKGQVEPMALIAVQALVGALPQIEALVVPLESEDIESREFLLREVPFVLSKSALEHLQFKFEIALEFRLEVLLPLKRVCDPPLG